MPREYFGFLRGCTPDTQNFLSAIPIHKVFKIGRDKDSDLIINANFLTGTHCEIRSTIKEDATFMAYITDKSVNGTYMNGCEIGYNKTVILYPNSIIQFGSQHIQLIYLQYRNHDINYYYGENFSILLHNNNNNNNKEINYNISITNKCIGSGKQSDVLLSHVAYRQRFQLACKKYRKHGLYRLPQTEIEMLKTNKHMNVLSIIREFDRDGYIYTFQPLYIGGTLTHHIENHRASEDEKNVFFIFHQILQGLQYIHRRGIIHCDLKTDNILLADLSNRPRIVITDFGLSIYSKSKNEWPEDYGTLVYHSPEIVENRTSFTEKVDCWAAGVILYQLLSKKHPFFNIESLENPLIKSIIKQSILNMDPNLDVVKHYSDQVRFVISKLLEKDPKKRYSTTDCINSQWALMHYDEAFYQSYHDIKIDYLKERAAWFKHEEEEESQATAAPHYNHKYHIDNDAEQVASLIERRGKSEDDPDSVFHRSTPVSKIYDFHFHYINTQLDVGREWRKRQSALQGSGIEMLDAVPLSIIN